MRTLLKNAIGLFACSILLGTVLLPVSGAHAATLFATGTGNTTSSRVFGDLGVGQGIAVSTTTNLTNIAVYLAMPIGGDVKFMIWDGTNSSLLLITPPEALAASTTLAFVESPSFSFTLNAGSTYFFGVIGDNNININFYFPTQPFNQNGLDALQDPPGNSNYFNYGSPIFDGNGSAQMTLQLFGTQAATPLPAALPLFASGLGAFGLLGWRRKRKAQAFVA